MNATNKRQFTGHERDPESGLDYMLARYYSSGFGRFTTVDPSRRGVNLERPTTWNRYEYTEDNPIDTYDPNGLASVKGRPLDIWGYGAPTTISLGFVILQGMEHRAIFFDNGDPDVGYYSDGQIRSDKSDLKDKYWTESAGYDDELMKKAVDVVKSAFSSKYRCMSNDCQDFVKSVLVVYWRLYYEQCGPHGCKKGPLNPQGPIPTPANKHK